MFDSVDIMQGKLDSMSPVGTDLETVKQQMEELKVLVYGLFSHTHDLVLIVTVIYNGDQSMKLFIYSLLTSDCLVNIIHLTDHIAAVFTLGVIHSFDPAQLALL